MWYGFVFFLPLLFLAVMLFVFWVVMLVDAVQRKYSRQNDKLVWVIIIVFTNFLGALIYYFAVHFKNKQRSMKWFWIIFSILLLLFIMIVLYVIIASFSYSGPMRLGLTLANSVF